jgi:uncharacterized protein YuzE
MGHDHLLDASPEECQVIVRYDPEADLIYVILEDGEGEVFGEEELDEHQRIVHRDARGEIVAVEFLLASRGIDLTGLPRAAEIADALRSLQRVPLSPAV